MKSFDRRKLTGGLVFTACLLLFLTSCQKEVVEKQYPSELTIQNWEEFVDAPMEVIEELERKERLALATDNPYTAEAPLDYRAPVAASGNQAAGQKTVSAVDGVVRAYGVQSGSSSSSWDYYAGVSVTRSNGSCGTFTLGSAIPPFAPSNYYLNCSTNSPARCLSTSTSYVNGVTTLDLVLVQKHILGLQPFTSWRQMCAGDVNNRGSLTAADILLMRKAILGLITSFPAGNVRFVSENFYSAGEFDWVNYGLYTPYPLGNCNNADDYRAIKVGDVNGTFVY